MKIVIIGAGAVGSMIAAPLSKFNYNIQLVCKHREILDAIENNGLRIEGLKDNLISYPNTVIDISQIIDKPDIIFLAMKANDVREVVQNIVPVLKDDTAVVSLQSGICEDIVSKIVQPQRTVGCVVSWGATVVGQGRIEVTSDGEFIIGELDGEVTHRLLIIKSILEKIFPVKISTNIYGSLYSRLILSSCISTLGAISGLCLGDLLNLQIARTLFLHILTEAVQVATSAQIKLEKIAGKIDLYQFALKHKELTSYFSFSLLKKHLQIQLMGLKYRKLKSPSLQSIERGKPTEIDFLNGYIVQKAQQYSVPATINQRLVAMVKDIEAGKLKIDPENLYQVI